MDREEVEVVVQLLRATRDLVDPEPRPRTGDPLEDLVGGMPDPAAEVRQPEDPALLRLLPPAHREDAEQAQEFRAMTERGLRTRKAATLDAALEALESAEGPRISLSTDQAAALGVALTDVRLVLGERLGLRTDEDAEQIHQTLARALAGEADVDPAHAQLIAYYDFLTWLQETVTTALLRR